VVVVVVLVGPDGGGVVVWTVQAAGRAASVKTNGVANDLRTLREDISQQ
jgi:hypothetical protein